VALDCVGTDCGLKKLGCRDIVGGGTLFVDFECEIEVP
jgi:hypothetical protein